jgi:predicted transglutaminase-like cysteine proteinase
MQRILNTLTFYLLVIYGSSVSPELVISQKVLGNIEKKYGSDAKLRTSSWQSMLIEARQAKRDQDKLTIINDFFNQNINFVSDLSHWGKNDYWATPLEFIASGAGDCEDFSIAKYFSLKEAGVAEKKLRLTYVKAINLGQAHMVLTYFARPRSIPLVLDNLIPQIKKANQRKDLLPVYSFNGSGLWIAKARGSGKRVGSSGRLSLWENLKQKMRSGQF